MRSLTCGSGRVVRLQMSHAHMANAPSRNSRVPRVTSTNQSEASTHSRGTLAVPPSGRGRKARSACMTGAVLEIVEDEPHGDHLGELETVLLEKGLRVGADAVGKQRDAAEALVPG